MVCDQLPDPVNGAVTGKDGEAVYTCDPGFSLCQQCNEKRLCGQDAKWTGTDVTCEGLFIKYL